MCVNHEGILNVGILSNDVSDDVRRSEEVVFGNAEKTITAIVEKARMEYTALKADRTVSRGECLKQVTPPPVSWNDIRRSEVKEF